MRAQRPSRRMFPHRVDVFRLDTEGTSDTGGTRIEAEPGATNVACLVSEHSGRRGPPIGLRDVERKTIRVLFPDDAALSEGTELRFADGGRTRVFQVNSYRSDLNLGRLWCAEVEEQVDNAAV